MVATSLLTTKLYVPSARTRLVSRPRLLKQLNEGVTAKLTIISAPAGYGKTTLLSEWVQQLNVPVAWLTLDINDNLPSNFWAYFVAALRKIPIWSNLNIGETLLGILGTQQDTSPDILLASLISEISDISERSVLVLDDLHLVTDPKIHIGLTFLIEHLLPTPNGMHLVIASRMDPPWPMARLRVSREIREVRETELRFTLEEITAFLNDVMRLALSSNDIAQLNRRTEGWIAGLQMAALSMQGREDVSSFIEGFSSSHRFVMDYLVEEVLNQQKPQTLEFLLQTSILKNLTPQLCDAITVSERGQTILTQLEKANMFLVPLDDERLWYRYHHLFKDLLYKRLKQTKPALVPQLHLLASQWYAQAGMLQEAVHHALAAPNYEFAAELIEQHVLEIFNSGEISLARQWTESLPDDVIHSRPILCVARARASMDYSSLESAEAWISEAETALETSIDENFISKRQSARDLINSQIAILQASIYRTRGEPTKKQQAFALQALESIIPQDDLTSRASLIAWLGMTYVDLGKDDEADRTFSQAFELGRTSGNYYAAYIASYGQMVIARRRGQLHKLAALCYHALSTIEEDGDRQVSIAGIAMVMLAGVLYERNEIEEATRHLIKGLALAERIGLAEIHLKGYYTLSCLDIAQGKLDNQRNLDAITVGKNPGLKAYAASLNAQINLLRSIQTNDGAHSFAESIRWAENQRLTLKEKRTYDWEIIAILVYARIHCFQYKTHPTQDGKNKLEATLQFIKDQFQRLETLGWNGTLLDAYITTSLILHVLERENKALVFLEKALMLAEPEGFTRIFFDQGKQMRALLGLVKTKGTAGDYAGKLLSAWGREIASQPAPEKTQGSIQIELLSQREVDVLHLLNSHLSVPEISDKLHVAPTTTRTHIQNIYRKLDVHSRIEALQKAKVLRLL
jgi:LuxR family maltose regulon positive regulatory protein